MDTGSWPSRGPDSRPVVPRLRGRRVEVGAAVAALRRGSDVVVVGPGGSGRTQVLDALSRTLPTVTVAEDVADTTALGRLVQGARRPGILAVDDGDRLTGGVRRGLEDRRNRPGLAVAVTLRLEDASRRTTVVGPWTRAGFGVVVLRELPGRSMRRIGEATIGGDLSDRTLGPLFDLAAGRPRDLIELLLGSRETGALEERVGRWRLEGPVATHRMESDLGERLRAAGHVVVDGMDLLLAGGPLPLTFAARAIGTDVIETLVDLGAVRSRVRDGRTRVEPARPAEAALLRDRWAPGHRERLLGRLVANAGPGAAPRELRDRLAAWCLEVGGGSSGLFLDAGRASFARGDVGFATACAEAALRRGASLEGTRLRGTIRTLAGGGRGAREDLRKVAAESSDHESLALMAVAVEHLRVCGTGRWTSEDPSRTGERGAATHPPAVHAYRALMAAVHGHVRLARRHLELLGDPEGWSPAFRDLAVTARAICGAFALDRDEVACARAQWAGGHTTVRSLPVGRIVPESAEIAVEACAGGRVAEAARAASEAFDAAERGGDVNGTIVWGIVCGMAGVAHGQVGHGYDVLLRTESVLDSAGIQVIRPLLLGRRAWVAAQAGRFAWARELASRAHVGSSGDPHEPYSPIVEAYLEVERDTEEAVRRTREVGDAAYARGDRAAAVEAYALPLRLGVANAQDQRRVAVLREERDLPMVALLDRHARALTTADPGGLVEAARGYARTGRTLLAAEAVAQAAERADGEAATLLRARAAALATACEGAWTPAIAELDRVTLTGREAEIARMVCAGWSNRGIAEQIVVSVRTVETHLTRVYRKVGVRTRSDLATFHGTLFS